MDANGMPDSPEEFREHSQIHAQAANELLRKTFEPADQTDPRVVAYATRANAHAALAHLFAYQARDAGS